MGPSAESPDAYIAALSGWRRACAAVLRSAIEHAAPFEQTIKWTNLVFMANGPCILIRAEPDRMLLGFWRGKRLREIEPRIKPSGKYELGNMLITDTTMIDAGTVAKLAAAAYRLNRELGDPTAVR